MFFFVRCLLLQYQFYSIINKHIDVSFSFLHAPVHLLAVRKHVRGYPLGTCNTFSSFKLDALQGVRSEPAEDMLTAHFSPVLYVKLLELEFVFRFLPQESIEGLRAWPREAKVSWLFNNRSNFIPGTLMVLVIADFLYYLSKFVFKPCRFVRDRRNFISCRYPILCIIRTLLSGLDLCWSYRIVLLYARTHIHTVQWCSNLPLLHWWDTFLLFHSLLDSFDLNLCI